MSADLLAAFRRLVFTNVFVGVALMLLVYFQLDVVSPEMVAIIFVYDHIMIVITVARSLISKSLF